MIPLHFLYVIYIDIHSANHTPFGDNFTFVHLNLLCHRRRFKCIIIINFIQCAIYPRYSTTFKS